MKKNIEKITQSVLSIADIHAKRISQGLGCLEKGINFNTENVLDLPFATIMALEIIASRFAKLQDLLGVKLFPLLLDSMQEGDSLLSVRDRLNRLEKLKIIASAEQWVEWRDMRNNIAHEYPDDPGLTAEQLNNLVTSAQQLLDFWKELRIKTIEEIQRN